MLVTIECKQCGKGFLGYESKTSHRTFCSYSCRAAFYNKARTKDKEQRECPVCHNLFDVTTVRTKYCSIKCRGIARRKPESEKYKPPVYVPKPPRIKACEICGAIITYKHGYVKYCPLCRGEVSKNYLRSKKYQELHRRNARRWQIENPDKQKAQCLAKSHPERLNILYECGCDAKKENHHPDYTKPFDVLRLCHSCHKKEHARLRDLTNQQAEVVFSQATA